MSASKSEKVEWIVEEFYFGSATYPSEATYRHCDGCLQKRVERSILLLSINGTNKYTAGVDNVIEFKANATDCEYLLMGGCETTDGRRVPPYLYLIGWKEITDKAGRELYEKDKKGAWPKPSSS